MNILITGATDGIGRQTALELAGMGRTIYIHGRDQHRIMMTIDMIFNETGNSELHGLRYDFSSLAEVSKMARDLKDIKIDVLINNAGIFPTEPMISQDGLELMFAVNYLAHFLLTMRIIDKPKRVINVGSITHASYINFSTLGTVPNKFNAFEIYKTSKLCNFLFSYKLAREYRHFTSNVLHPGIVNTELNPLGYQDVGYGAITPVYLATSDEVENITGRYFDNKKLAHPNAIALDKYYQDKLWGLSVQMTGQY